MSEGGAGLAEPDGRPGHATTLAGALAELSRTRLLLNLATLPDLALEAEPPTALGPSLRHVAEVIQRALGVGTVGFALRDSRNGHLVPAGSAGLPEDPVAAAEPVLSRVFATGAPLRLHAATAGGAERQLLERLLASALAVVPIAVDAEPRGVLYVADRRPAPFADEDLAFLVLVAGRVGLLLERAELTRAQREIERQRAQAAARQELLGIVTHELKTPVAVLRAYTELLLARAEQAGRADDAALLARMDEQAARLLAMVEQILDLQRLDAGLFPLEISRVDLAALARRVAEGLQLAAPNVRLAVHADPADHPDRSGGAGRAEGPIDARADRRRIEQVLTNLLQNAIRFAPPHTEVSVYVRRSRSLITHHSSLITHQAPDEAAAWALVSVSDRGPGVAARDRARIFERFYQGEGGDRLHRGHGGLGVGLYIAREIVARHGGDLWLEPAAAEGGATFTFALPVAGPPE